MCLLVTQNQQSPALSREWLADFYDYNSDGVGVMYAKDGALIVEKILPVSADDFVQFYQNHIAGKNCAFHLRMRTHGDTDLTNCHPYEVLNQQEHGTSLWLMHNGILSTGNKADTSKSDTWHYIRDYLRPMLAGNPDYAFTPAFSAIVGTHIGSSNKFVLMDEQGRQAVVNQTSGVYWSGLWLSNTYAWTASPSASKTPAKKSKKAQAQAIKQSKEVPESRLPVAYSTGYGVGSGSVYNSREYYYPDYYDLENTLDDLAVMGFEDASRITSRKLDAFVDVFGVNAFLDLAEMLMSGEINEAWFIEGITDHKCARVDFALKPFNSYSEV
jgi:hypothetical protein